MPPCKYLCSQNGHRKAPRKRWPSYTGSMAAALFFMFRIAEYSKIYQYGAAPEAVLIPYVMLILVVGHQVHQQKLRKQKDLAGAFYCKRQKHQRENIPQGQIRDLEYRFQHCDMLSLPSQM